MPIALLLPNYLIWHYSKGLKEMLQIWGNLLYFIIHYFSLPNLFRTLFSPWKRMNEEASRTINPSAIMEHVIFNTLLRIIGFFIRLATIIAGLVVTLFVITSGLAVFAVWLTMPFVLVALFMAGILLIVKPTA